MDLSKFESQPTTTQHGILSETRVEAKEKGEHIYAVKYSPDGKYYAATYGNGCCRLFETEGNTPVGRAKLGPQHDDIPSTGVKFIGDKKEDGSYLFASASSAGAIYGWNYNPNGAAGYIDRSFRFLEDKNDTSCLDVCPNSKFLVSAGSDRKVRVYDLETNKLVTEMDKGTDDSGHSRPAHTNRIFSVKFASETTLLSAGWEAPVQIWDLRTHRSERQLGGPQVSSDCIEIIPDQHSRCIIASSRTEKQLQVFDFIGAREIESESEKLSANLGKMHMTSVRYAQEEGCIWAIGSKPDALINLDAKTGDVRGMVEYTAPVYGIDVSAHHPQNIMVCGMKETLASVTICDDEDEEEEEDA